MQTTTNLNLNLPELADSALIGKLNENFEKLDSEVLVSKTARGNIVTAQTAKAPFSALTIYGHTEKSDNTLATAGSDGTIKLTKCGKNMFDINRLVTEAGFTVASDGSVSGKAYALYNRYTRIKGGFLANCFKENTQYIYKADCKTEVEGTSTLSMYFYYTDGTNTSMSVNSADYETYEFISNANKTVKMFAFHYITNGTVNIKNAILCEGTSAEYEPYNGTTIDFSTPNGLASVGDVADTLEVRADGTGVLTERLGKVDLGTLTWVLMSGNRFRSSEIGNLKMAISQYTPINVLCSHYAASDFNTIYSQEVDHTIGGAYNNRNLHMVDKTYTDATALKNSLAGVMCYFELATPTVTELSAEEVSAFLALTSNKGITNVFTDDIAEVEVTYAVNSESANYLGEIIEGLKARLDALENG